MHLTALHGEYDISRADELRAELHRCVDEHEAILVDVSDAEFLDAAILGVLLGTFQRARAAGVDFALAFGPATRPAVRRTFEATGLDRVFPTAPAPTSAGAPPVAA